MKLLVFLYSFISLNDLLTPIPGECPVLVNHNYYNLCPFVGTPPLKLTTDSMNISFNLGQEQVISCSGSQAVWGTATNIEGDCFNFYQASADHADTDAEDASDGIEVIFTSNKVNNQTLNMRVALYCDRDNQGDTSLQLTVDNISTNGNNIFINVKTKSYYGCAVATSNEVMDFLLANKAFFAPILVGIGILYCFFGLKYFNIVIYITLIGAIIIFISLLLEETAMFSISQLIILVVLGLLIAADLILTYSLKKIKTMGYIIVGTAFGAVNGVIFYDTMLSPILKANVGDAIFYIMVSICCVAAAVIGAWVQKDGFITFTAFIGSFLIIRPLSSFFGGYPSEIAVASGLEDFNTVTYAYLMLVLIVASLGNRFQTKRYKELLKSKKSKDEMITFSEYMHFL